MVECSGTPNKDNLLLGFVLATSRQIDILDSCEFGEIVLLLRKPCDYFQTKLNRFYRGCSFQKVNNINKLG